MKALGLNEIREQYLSFFESKGHLRKESAPLVPINDDSLLLINSGMAPLKPYFKGEEVPPSNRMTTCQKCIRTPDIDNVGKTARHGTFFEMLGNFSFGDYFKKEAIEWAWEFVVDVLEIPRDRLYASVYEEDDEAYDIWHQVIGLSENRIVRLGKADNFWEHGLGPCGPSSEIYYDRGEKYGCDDPHCQVGCECDRYIEFWNLVFTQFDKDAQGNYHPLANPNIDTGMGLERMATIMQGVDTIFEVDTIDHVLQEISKLAGVAYKEDEKKDVSIRVIADHIRSVSFMVADGVIPSNEGRGYVLRRLLRRAARHGKLLGIEGNFLVGLAKEVEKMSGEAYPELVEKSDYIAKVLRIEETKFQETIDQGLVLLDEYMKALKKQKATVLKGEDAFKLYDTFGFPLDLTKDILMEKGFDVDEEQFNRHMQAQKERARKARNDDASNAWTEDPFEHLSADQTTAFTGYNRFEDRGRILGMVCDGNPVEKVEKGQEVLLVMDRTPFYAESGGQTGDTGWIEGPNGRMKIMDCKKGALNRHIHYGLVEEGSFEQNEEVRAKIDVAKRRATARNHTATHILHKSLKEVLGSHVEQAGSLVSPDRLRFDFNHFEKMTEEERWQVETRVNEIIENAFAVDKFETDKDEAKKMGATALFGEKYDEKVRVVKIDDFSMELCGGTHVDNISEIGIFKILSETGVAAGVRRIEAVTGANTLNYLREIDEKIKQATGRLKATPDTMLQRIEELFAANKQLEKEIEELKKENNKNQANQYLTLAKKVADTQVIVAQADKSNMDDMRNLAEKLRDELQEGIVVLGGENQGKVQIVAMGSKSLVKRGFHAGNIVKEAAKITGGGGGGRPDMAQAGGKDPGKIQEALNKAFELIEQQIN